MLSSRSISTYPKVYDLIIKILQNASDAKTVSMAIERMEAVLKRESNKKFYMLYQFKDILKRCHQNKKVIAGIHAWIQKEILNTQSDEIVGFDCLLYVYFHLYLPYKLDTAEIEKTLQKRIESTIQNRFFYTELVSVLFMNANSIEEAKLQRKYIALAEKTYREQEEKSALASQRLVDLYSKMLSSVSIFSRLNEAERPEYLKRKVIASIKMYLLHPGLVVNLHIANDLKEQIAAVIYSPCLNEVIATLLIETRNLSLQRALLEQTESMLVERATKSLAAATNLIHFNLQYLSAKNKSLIQMNIDGQEEFIQLLCQVYLRDDANEFLKKDCKNHLKLLIKHNQLIKSQAEFALNFLRSFKKPSRDIPQNLFACAKALIIYPELSKEKVKTLYDYADIPQSNGKSDEYGQFDDENSLKYQHHKLACWYLQEIKCARKSNHAEAYLLQASIAGQPTYIREHLVAALKSLGMDTRQIESLQRLTIKMMDQDKEEKTTPSLVNTFFGTVVKAKPLEEKKEQKEQKEPSLKSPFL